MYKLKQVPEDFVVEEVPDRDLSDKGDFAVFELRKRNYTTEEAVSIVSEKLKVDRKRVKYAGNKDKFAVTSQRISIFKFKGKDLSLNNISLRLLGYSDEPVSLGNLKGNGFVIVVRNLEKDSKIKKLKKVPNFFDEQRFSKNNVEIGRFIIKRDFRSAVMLINDFKVNNFLKKNPNDFVGALRLMLGKILSIYVHAYQSFIWNKTISEYLKVKEYEESVPIIGFATELEGELKVIIEKIIKEEDIELRDFVIKEIPELSSEGAERKLFCEVKNLRVSGLEKDELNNGKFKMKLRFELDKGCYATNVVRFLVL